MKIIDKYNPPEPKYMQKIRKLRKEINRDLNPITENIARKDFDNAKNKSKTSDK